MELIPLGWRNLVRNARRSLAVVASIAIGFAAVVLLAGYMKTVYRGLSDQAVYGELIGHLTVAKRNLASDRHLNPKKALLTQDEIERIARVAQAVDPGLYIAPRLAITGMLTNGKASTIFIAEGVDPTDMQALRGPRSMASGGLRADQPVGISIAEGLAGMLGLKSSDAAALLVSTIHGQANAADASIVDIFSTGNAGTNDKFMFMPLQLAQALVDAEHRADRITLLRRQGPPGPEMLDELAANLQQAGLDVEVRGWEAMSSFYRQVKLMFDMIFNFLLAIVLTIVVLSVTNAMSASVIERTREVGTLRAIGMSRWLVVRMFSVEALLLVQIGCLLGLALAVALSYGVNAANIHYLPPNSTDPVMLLIGFDLPRTLAAALAITLLGIIAAVLPSARAAGRPIPESLAHV